ncbi:SAM-dependent methyltransferase, partial [Candidatus Omnitrophota bacterium]
MGSLGNIYVIDNHYEELLCIHLSGAFGNLGPYGNVLVRFDQHDDNNWPFNQEPVLPDMNLEDVKRLVSQLDSDPEQGIDSFIMPSLLTGFITTIIDVKPDDYHSPEQFDQFTVRYRYDDGRVHYESYLDQARFDWDRTRLYAECEAEVIDGRLHCIVHDQDGVRDYYEMSMNTSGMQRVFRNNPEIIVGEYAVVVISESELEAYLISKGLAQQELIGSLEWDYITKGRCGRNTEHNERAARFIEYFANLNIEFGAFVCATAPGFAYQPQAVSWTKKLIKKLRAGSPRGGAGSSAALIALIVCGLWHLTVGTSPETIGVLTGFFGMLGSTDDPWPASAQEYETEFVAKSASLKAMLSQLGEYYDEQLLLANAVLSRIPGLSRPILRAIVMIWIWEFVQREEIRNQQEFLKFLTFAKFTNPNMPLQIKNWLESGLSKSEAVQAAVVYHRAFEVEFARCYQIFSNYFATEDLIGQVYVSTDKQKFALGHFPTLAQVAQEANYNPYWGYFGSGKWQLGTEMEGYAGFSHGLYPASGWMIAEQTFEAWRERDEPGEFTVLELGSGQGAIVNSFLVYCFNRQEQDPRWERFFSSLRYVSVERNFEYAQNQRQVNDAFIQAGKLIVAEGNVLEYVESLSDGSIQGVAFCIDLLDALPFYLLGRKEGQYATPVVVPLIADALVRAMDEQGLLVAAATTNVERMRVNTQQYKRLFGLARLSEDIVILHKTDFFKLKEFFARNGDESLRDIAMDFERTVRYIEVYIPVTYDTLPSVASYVDENRDMLEQLPTPFTHLAIPDAARLLKRLGRKMALGSALWVCEQGERGATTGILQFPMGSRSLYTFLGDFGLGAIVDIGACETAGKSVDLHLVAEEEVSAALDPDNILERPEARSEIANGFVRMFGVDPIFAPQEVENMITTFRTNYRTKLFRFVKGSGGTTALLACVAFIGSWLAFSQGGAGLGEVIVGAGMVVSPSLIQYKTSRQHVGFDWMVSQLKTLKLRIDWKLYWLAYIFRTRGESFFVDAFLLMMYAKSHGVDVYAIGQAFYMEEAEYMPEHSKLWGEPSDVFNVYPEEAIFAHPAYALKALDMLRWLEDTGVMIEQAVALDPVQVIDLGDGRYWIVEGIHRAFLCFMTGIPVAAQVTEIKPGNEDFLEFLQQEAREDISTYLKSWYCNLPEDIAAPTIAALHGEMTFSNILQILMQDIELAEVMSSRAAQNMINRKETENEIRIAVDSMDNDEQCALVDVMQLLSHPGYNFKIFGEFCAVFTTFVDSFEPGQEFDLFGFREMMGEAWHEDEGRLAGFLHLIAEFDWIYTVGLAHFIRLPHEFEQHPHFPFSRKVFVYDLCEPEILAGFRGLTLGEFRRLREMMAGEENMVLPDQIGFTAAGTLVTGSQTNCIGCALVGAENTWSGLIHVTPHLILQHESPQLIQQGIESAFADFKARTGKDISLAGTRATIIIPRFDRTDLTEFQQIHLREIALTTMAISAGISLQQLEVLIGLDDSGELAQQLKLHMEQIRIAQELSKTIANRKVAAERLEGILNALGVVNIGVNEDSRWWLSTISFSHGDEVVRAHELFADSETIHKVGIGKTQNGPSLPGGATTIVCALIAFGLWHLVSSLGFLPYILETMTGQSQSIVDFMAGQSQHIGEVLMGLAPHILEITAEPVAYAPEGLSEIAGALTGFFCITTGGKGNQADVGVNPTIGPLVKGNCVDCLALKRLIHQAALRITEVRGIPVIAKAYLGGLLRHAERQFVFLDRWNDIDINIAYQLQCPGALEAIRKEEVLGAYVAAMNQLLPQTIPGLDRVYCDLEKQELAETAISPQRHKVAYIDLGPCDSPRSAPIDFALFVVGRTDSFERKVAIDILRYQSEMYMRMIHSNYSEAKRIKIFLSVAFYLAQFCADSVGVRLQFERIRDRFLQGPADPAYDRMIEETIHQEHLFQQLGDVFRRANASDDFVRKVVDSVADIVWHYDQALIDVEEEVLPQAFADALAQVRSLRGRGKRGIAVFDASGTLWATGTTGSFARYEIALLEKLEDYDRAEAIRAALAAYKAKGIDVFMFLDRLILIHVGLEDAVVQDRARQWFRDEFAEKVNHPFITFIRLLKQLGIDEYILSNSARWIVNAGAEYIGCNVQRAFTVGPEVNAAGIITDRIVYPELLKEQGKLAALRHVDNRDILFAAADSPSDIAILKESAVSLAVTSPKSKNLLAIARQKGWLVVGIGLGFIPYILETLTGQSLPIVEFLAGQSQHLGEVLMGLGPHISEIMAGPVAGGLWHVANGANGLSETIGALTGLFGMVSGGKDDDWGESVSPPGDLQRKLSLSEVLEYAENSARHKASLLEEGEDVVISSVISEEELYISVETPENIIVLQNQVFAELIYNALKYSKPNGTITLTIRKEGNQAIVIVEDNGIGISKEDIEKVWDDGYRAPNARNKADGSGYGLWRVRQVVEHGFGGTITLESTENVGTKFTVTLPLEQAQDAIDPYRFSDRFAGTIGRFELRRESEAQYATDAETMEFSVLDEEKHHIGVVQIKIEFDHERNVPLISFLSITLYEDWRGGGLGTAIMERIGALFPDGTCLSAPTVHVPSLFHLAKIFIERGAVKEVAFVNQCIGELFAVIRETEFAAFRNIRLSYAMPVVVFGLAEIITLLVKRGERITSEELMQVPVMRFRGYGGFTEDATIDYDEDGNTFTLFCRKPAATKRARRGNGKVVGIGLALIACSIGLIANEAIGAMAGIGMLIEPMGKVRDVGLSAVHRNERAILRQLVAENGSALLRSPISKAIDPENLLGHKRLPGFCRPAMLDIDRRVRFSYQGSAVTVEVKHHQVADLLGVKQRHRFAVVEFKGIAISGHQYIVDTTFVQFFDPWYWKHDKETDTGRLIVRSQTVELAWELLVNGFIEITDEAVQMYGLALSRDFRREFQAVEFLGPATEKESSSFNLLNREATEKMGLLSDRPLIEPSLQESLEVALQKNSLWRWARGRAARLLGDVRRSGLSNRRLTLDEDAIKKRIEEFLAEYGIDILFGRQIAHQMLIHFGSERVLRLQPLVLRALAIRLYEEANDLVTTLGIKSSQVANMLLKDKPSRIRELSTRVKRVAPGAYRSIVVQAYRSRDPRAAVNRILKSRGFRTIVVIIACGIGLAPYISEIMLDPHTSEIMVGPVAGVFGMVIGTHGKRVLKNRFIYPTFSPTRSSKERDNLLELGWEYATQIAETDNTLSHINGKTLTRVKVDDGVLVSLESEEVILVDSKEFFVGCCLLLTVLQRNDQPVLSVFHVLNIESAVLYFKAFHNNELQSARMLAVAALGDRDIVGDLCFLREKVFLDDSQDAQSNHMLRYDHHSTVLVGNKRDSTLINGVCNFLITNDGIVFVQFGRSGQDVLYVAGIEARLWSDMGFDPFAQRSETKTTSPKFALPVKRAGPFLMAFCAMIATWSAVHFLPSAQESLISLAGLFGMVAGNTADQDISGSVGSGFSIRRVIPYIFGDVIGLRLRSPYRLSVTATEDSVTALRYRNGPRHLNRNRKPDILPTDILMRWSAFLGFLTLLVFNAELTPESTLIALPGFFGMVTGGENQSDEHDLPNRVMAYLDSIAARLHSELQKEWSRYPDVCGVSSIILAKILSDKFDLPISGEAKTRLEIRCGIRHNKSNVRLTAAKYFWVVLIVDNKEELFIGAAFEQVEQKLAQCVVVLPYERAFEEFPVIEANDTSIIRFIESSDPRLKPFLDSLFQGEDVVGPELGLMPCRLVLILTSLRGLNEEVQQGVWNVKSRADEKGIERVVQRLLADSKEDLPVRTSPGNFPGSIQAMLALCAVGLGYFAFQQPVSELLGGMMVGAGMVCGVDKTAYQDISRSVGSRFSPYILGNDIGLRLRCPYRPTVTVTEDVVTDRGYRNGLRHPNRNRKPEILPTNALILWLTFLGLLALLLFNNDQSIGTTAAFSMVAAGKGSSDRSPFPNTFHPLVQEAEAAMPPCWVRKPDWNRFNVVIDKLKALEKHQSEGILEVWVIAGFELQGNKKRTRFDFRLRKDDNFSKIMISLEDKIQTQLSLGQECFISGLVENMNQHVSNGIALVVLQECSEGTIQIVVADNGPGLISSAGTRVPITQAIQRGFKAGLRSRCGTGLPWAISADEKGVVLLEHPRESAVFTSIKAETGLRVPRIRSLVTNKRAFGVRAVYYGPRSDDVGCQDKEGWREQRVNFLMQQAEECGFEVIDPFRSREVVNAHEELYRRVANEARAFIKTHKQTFIGRKLEYTSCQGHAIEVKRRLEKLNIPSEIYYWVNRVRTKYHFWVVTLDGFLIDALPPKLDFTIVKHIHCAEHNYVKRTVRRIGDDPNDPWQGKSWQDQKGAWIRVAEDLEAKQSGREGTRGDQNGGVCALFGLPGIFDSEVVLIAVIVLWVIPIILAVGMFIWAFLHKTPDSLLQEQTKPIHEYQFVQLLTIFFLPLLVTVAFVLTVLGVSANLIAQPTKNPFFTQTRLGYLEKPFTILKIRTMDENEHSLWFQKLMRDFPVDETPQVLWNMLIRRQMVLIGPRPKQPSELPGLFKKQYCELGKPGFINGITARVGSGYRSKQEGKIPALKWTIQTLQYDRNHMSFGYAFNLIRLTAAAIGKQVARRMRLFIRNIMKKARRDSGHRCLLVVLAGMLTVLGLQQLGAGEFLSLPLLGGMLGKGNSLTTRKRVLYRSVLYVVRSVVNAMRKWLLGRRSNRGNHLAIIPFMGTGLGGASPGAVNSEWFLAVGVVIGILLLVHSRRSTVHSPWSVVYGLLSNVRTPSISRLKVVAKVILILAIAFIAAHASGDSSLTLAVACTAAGLPSRRRFTILEPVYLSQPLSGEDYEFKLPTGDTFISRDEQAKIILPALVALDVERNRGARRLSYYLNGGQRKDLATLIDALKTVSGKIAGWDITIVISNIIDFTRERAVETLQRYQDLRLLPRCNMMIQWVWMDHGQPELLEQFAGRFNGFSGTMSNLGSADPYRHKELAAALWQTTQAEGWIQSDNHAVLESLIAIAEQKAGKRRIISKSLERDPHQSGFPQNYCKKELHYVVKVVASLALLLLAGMSFGDALLPSAMVCVGSMGGMRKQDPRVRVGMEGWLIKWKHEFGAPNYFHPDTKILWETFRTAIEPLIASRTHSRVLDVGSGRCLLELLVAQQFGSKVSLFTTDYAAIQPYPYLNPKFSLARILLSLIKSQRKGGRINPTAAKIYYDQVAYPHRHVRAVADDLPFASNRFDIIFANFLLSYVLNPVKALQEMNRVLSKGGYVVSLLHHPQSVYSQRAVLGSLLIALEYQLLKRMRSYLIDGSTPQKEALLACDLLEHVWQETVQLLGEGTRPTPLLGSLRLAVQSGKNKEKTAELIHFMQLMNLAMIAGPLSCRPFSGPEEIIAAFAQGGFSIRKLSEIETPSKTGIDIAWCAVAEKVFHGSGRKLGCFALPAPTLLNQGVLHQPSLIHFQGEVGAALNDLGGSVLQPIFDIQASAGQTGLPVAMTGMHAEVNFIVLLSFAIMYYLIDALIEKGPAIFSFFKSFFKECIESIAFAKELKADPAEENLRSALVQLKLHFGLPELTREEVRELDHEEGRIRPLHLRGLRVTAFPFRLYADALLKIIAEHYPDYAVRNQAAFMLTWPRKDTKDGGRNVFRNFGFVFLGNDFFSQQNLIGWAIIFGMMLIFGFLTRENIKKVRALIKNMHIKQRIAYAGSFLSIVWKLFRMTPDERRQWRYNVTLAALNLEHERVDSSFDVKNWFIQVRERLWRVIDAYQKDDAISEDLNRCLNSFRQLSRIYIESMGTAIIEQDSFLAAIRFYILSLKSKEILETIQVHIQNFQLLSLNDSLEREVRIEIENIVFAMDLIACTLDIVEPRERNVITWKELEEKIKNAPERRSGNKRIDIEFVVPEILSEFYGYPEVIKAMILHLILNARDRGKATKVTIKLEAIGSELILSIDDNGIGMCGTDIPEKFKLNVGEGTGLGLAFCVRAAEINNGHIRVVSRQVGDSWHEYCPGLDSQARPVLDGNTLRQLTKPSGTIFEINFGKQKLPRDDDWSIRPRAPNAGRFLPWFRIDTLLAALLSWLRSISLQSFLKLCIGFAVVGVTLCADFAKPISDGVMLTSAMGAGSIFATYEDEDLRRVRTCIEQLWHEKPQLFHGFGDGLLSGHILSQHLAEKGCMQLLKSDARKLILVSQEGRYIIKINWEPDYAFEKELQFFPRFNPLALPQLVYAHAPTRALVFNNVTYKTDNITLFEFIHTPGIAREQLCAAMRSLAQTLAQIHAMPLEGIRKDIHEDQSFAARNQRAKMRLRFLRDQGYGQLPSEQAFESMQLPDEAIVMNHGDPSPWNMFVDPWDCQVTAMIDAEACSLGTRSKCLAKVVITLLDARKNNPILIEYFDAMLTAFFDAYFETSDAAPEEIMQALPYYIATEGLWYALETHRIFKNRFWVGWRLELCEWALRRSEFSIERLREFLSEEIVHRTIKEVGDLWINARNFQGFGLGATVEAVSGEAVGVNVLAKLSHPVRRILSMLEVGVQLWTDCDRIGIWGARGPVEFGGFWGEQAVFSSRVSPTVPSGYNRFYGLTVNASLHGEQKWCKPGGQHVSLAVKNIRPTGDDRMLWESVSESIYRAVMVDWDGTWKDYETAVRERMFELAIEKNRQGIPLAISTNRNDIEEVEAFFREVLQRMAQRQIDCQPDLFHIYYSAGGFNVGTGQRYYSVRLNDDARGAAHAILDTSEFGRFIVSSMQREQRIDFTFQGGVSRQLFARKLNERLNEVNGMISQRLTALHSEDYFQIVSEEGLKRYHRRDFSQRIGVPETEIASIGDQGQQFGLDDAFIFTVRNHNPESVYPVSTLQNIWLGNVDGTIWLLENLRFEPPGKVIKRFPIIPAVVLGVFFVVLIVLFVPFELHSAKEHVTVFNFIPSVFCLARDRAHGKYFINEFFMGRIASSLQWMRGGGLLNDIDLQSESAVDDERVVFSETQPPDTWPMIRRIVASLHQNPHTPLLACGRCAQLVIYYLVKNLQAINASGTHTIEAIQMAVHDPEHNWPRVKFSGYADGAWVVLDISSTAGVDGYYGLETVIQPGQGRDPVDYTDILGVTTVVCPKEKLISYLRREMGRLLGCFLVFAALGFVLSHIPLSSFANQSIDITAFIFPFLFATTGSTNRDDHSYPLQGDFAEVAFAGEFAAYANAQIDFLLRYRQIVRQHKGFIIAKDETALQRFATFLPRLMEVKQEVKQSCGLAQVDSYNLLERHFKVRKRWIKWFIKGTEHFKGHGYCVVVLAGIRFILDLTAEQFEPGYSKGDNHLGICLIPAEVAYEHRRRFGFYLINEILHKE